MGFEICQLDGIETFVLGSYTKAGEVFALDIKVLDVKSKELMQSASSHGQGISSILTNHIDELSDNIFPSNKSHLGSDRRKSLHLTYLILSQKLQSLNYN